MVRADIPAQTGDTGKPQALKDVRVPGFQTVDLAHAGRHAAVGQQREQAFQDRSLSHGGSAGEKEHLTRHCEPPISKRILVRDSLPRRTRACQYQVRLAGNLFFLTCGVGSG